MVCPNHGRVILVEGTSGIGKSTLLDWLARSYFATAPPRRIRTFLHLTQAHTYGPLAPAEDRRTLSIQQNLDHLDRIVSHLDWLVGSLVETQPKLFALVDTLHLTHCQRPGVVRFDDVAAIDERLARIDVRLLFLEATPDVIWNRSIVPRRGEEFLDVYARKLGSTDEAILDYFVREQAAMRGDFERSAMKKLLMGVAGPIETYAAEARAFWMD